MKNLNQNLKLLVLAVTLSFGLSYVYGWTAPTQVAPGGNIATPINTSTSSQVKTGGLGVTNLLADTLNVFGVATSTDFCLATGVCLSAIAQSSGSGGALTVYKSDGTTPIGRFIQSVNDAENGSFGGAAIPDGALQYLDASGYLKLVTYADRLVAINTISKLADCTGIEYVTGSGSSTVLPYRAYKLNDGSYVLISATLSCSSGGYGTYYQKDTSGVCKMYGMANSVNNCVMVRTDGVGSASSFFKRAKLCGAGDCIIK